MKSPQRTASMSRKSLKGWTTKVVRNILFISGTEVLSKGELGIGCSSGPMIYDKKYSGLALRAKNRSKMLKTLCRYNGGYCYPMEDLRRRGTL